MSESTWATEKGSETKAADTTPMPGNKDSGAQPSGPKGDNPATAGPGKTEVKSDTPENKAGHINPSPEDVNATPGTLGEK